MKYKNSILLMTTLMTSTLLVAGCSSSTTNEEIQKKVAVGKPTPQEVTSNVKDIKENLKPVAKENNEQQKIKTPPSVSVQAVSPKENVVTTEKYTSNENKNILSNEKVIPKENNLTKENTLSKGNAPKENSLAKAPITPMENKITLMENKVSKASIAVNTNPVEKRSLFDVKEEKDFTPTFHSEWKSSPSSLYQATIEGRGDKAQEEGYGTLVIQNQKTHVSKLFTLRNEQETQLTPKYVEWIDDNRVYVIIGQAYGTVSKGGNLYELNLSTNEAIPVIENLNKKEEIISVQNNKNGTFTYLKHVYDDDIMNVGHIEKGTISPTLQ